MEKVEELIMKTLEELAEKGFESDDIKAAVSLGFVDVKNGWF